MRNILDHFVLFKYYSAKWYGYDIIFVIIFHGLQGEDGYSVMVFLLLFLSIIWVRDGNDKNE